MDIYIHPFGQNKEDIKQLKQLFKVDPFYPYRYYNKISPSKYRNYLLHKIIQLNKKENLRDLVFLAKRKERVIGIIASEFSSWDSAYFSIPMAKIDFFKAIGSQKQIIKIKNMLINSIIQACKQKGIKHLTIRVDLMDNTSLHVLGEAGFKIMALEGVNILDRIKNKNVDKKSPILKIEKLKEEHIPQVIRIAEEIAPTLMSHYHFDTNLPKDKISNYYIENVKNCCSGHNANEVIIAKDNHEIIGFLAYRLIPAFTQIIGLSQAYIVLFAISSSKKGKGYSSVFIHKVSKYLLNKFDFIIGNVYLHNIPAIRLLAKFDPQPFCQYLYCLHGWI